jgi:hypothetical protein
MEITDDNFSNYNFSGNEISGFSGEILQKMLKSKNINELLNYLRKYEKYILQFNLKIREPIWEKHNQPNQDDYIKWFESQHTILRFPADNMNHQ